MPGMISVARKVIIKSTLYEEGSRGEKVSMAEAGL